MENAFVVNAQPNNSTSIPSADTSVNKPDYSLYIQIITAISSAAAAIFGGYIASSYSHKKALELEILRYERERKREKDIQEQQEKQNEEYMEKVRVVIYLELLEASSDFKVMMDKEFWKTYPESGYVETFRHTVESAMTSHEFTKLPFDLKLRLFTPDVLYSVQNAYTRIDFCYRTLLILLAQHQPGSLKDFESEVMSIASGFKENIDNVIEDLKKILPKSIVDKFKV